MSVADVKADPAVPNAELVSVFDELERAQLRWCVLRLPVHAGKSGGDVDLLIEPRDVPRLRPLMARLGFVELRGWSGGIHFIRYASSNDRWLWLHFVTRLDFGPRGELRTGAAETCLAHRNRTGAFPVLAKTDAFWVLLLHCLLDKGMIAPRYREQLADLAPYADLHSTLALAYALRCPRGWTPADLIAAVGSGD